MQCYCEMKRIHKKCVIVIFSIMCFIIMFFLQSRNEDSVRKSALFNRLEYENRKLRFQLASCSAYRRAQGGAAWSSAAAGGAPRPTPELDEPPSSLFTPQWVYPAEPRAGGRVREPTRSRRREDLNLAVTAALNMRTEPFARQTVEDFIEGNFKEDSLTGTEYQLIFKNRSSPFDYYRLFVQRPFCQFRLKWIEPRVNGKIWVHIILPLAGRISSFESFMERFSAISRYDGFLALVVVYFGEKELREARAVLANFPGLPAELVALREEHFSRARALRVGAERVRGDQLLFFCDVDIVFTFNFVQRCRWNSAPGHQAYYPIVFSLYNPRFVYTLNGHPVPPGLQQFKINKETGFWRDFGYGMTCQYKSDFVRWYDPSWERQRLGWGGEDVALYRRQLESMHVLRATDPDIFHVWHEKVCSPAMRPLQLRACLRSRARTEATHAQLGLVALAGSPSLGTPNH